MNGYAVYDGKESLSKLPNPSLQVTADHRLKTTDAPIVAPGRGQVLLHIKTTGICGYEIATPRFFSMSAAF